MKSRIDFEAMVEDPLHWVRIALYVGILSALVIPLGSGIDLLVHRTGAVRTTLPPVYPDIMAGGIRVGEGIAAFRGEWKPLVWQRQMTEMLATLVVSGVLLPALFLWGVRARARWRQQPGSRGLLTRITLALTVGGFSILLLISSIPFAMMARDVQKNLRRDNAVQAARELLAIEGMMMATHARTLYFLPPERGGSGGAWMTRDGMRRPLITLEDVRMPEPLPETVFEHVVPPTPETFVLEVANPDSLIIWGIGSEKSGNEDTLLNKDGRRGMIQVHVRVTPDRTTIISMID